MSINIKDPATDRLARDLAQATGESLTDAIRTAVEERLGRVRRARPSGDELQMIINRGRAREIQDQRSEAEILGYGDDGLPT